MPGVLCVGAVPAPADTAGAGGGGTACSGTICPAWATTTGGDAAPVVARSASSAAPTTFLAGGGSAASAPRVADDVAAPGDASATPVAGNDEAAVDGDGEDAATEVVGVGVRPGCGAALPRCAADGAAGGDSAGADAASASEKSRPDASPTSGAAAGGGGRESAAADEATALGMRSGRGRAGVAHAAPGGSVAAPRKRRATLRRARTFQARSRIAARRNDRATSTRNVSPGANCRPPRLFAGPRVPLGLARALRWHGCEPARP